MRPGGFTTWLPDWYHEAERLSEAERIDWDRAFERVLDCEYTLLTEDAMLGSDRGPVLAERCTGFFVLIETPLASSSRSSVPNPTDWLPFLTTTLTPLIAAGADRHARCKARSACERLHRLGAPWRRSHVDRETGLSRIDLDNDRDRRRVERARAAMARADKGGAA